MQDVVDILVAAKAKIATPSTWTQGAIARTSDLVMTEALSPDAVCFCSLGALGSLERDGSAWSVSHTAAYHLLNKALVTVGEDFLTAHIAKYNDTHTHAEVMAVWDKAIKLAKEEV